MRKKQQLQIPDPRLHQRISFLKSALRLGAGVVLLLFTNPFAGSLLIAAEILGIAEELV
jgi:hypothetical protein